MLGSMEIERPAAVLFDMDGTLTVPLLDYDAIRRDLGLRPEQGILETMRQMGPADRAAADAVLLRHETDAAERSALNAGCMELLDHLRDVGLPLAVVTRNSRRSVDLTLGKHRLADRFAAVVTREDEPFKPDPHPLRLACEGLNVAPDAVWLVGDGRHDVEAAVAAGVRCVWVSHGSNRTFDAVPWRTVETLWDVLRLVRRSTNEHE